MIRRIVWSLGDSQPVYNSVSIAVNGTGTTHINLGFQASSVQVSFSRTYPSNIAEPKVSVLSTDALGFTLSYQNIPNPGTLDVNYFVM